MNTVTTDFPPSAPSAQFLRVNAALIHFIKDNPGQHSSADALARALGRDASNLRKSIKTLRDAMIVVRENPIALSQYGEGFVDANVPKPAEPANAVRVTSDVMPDGFAMVDHQLIVPDLLNPRKDFDEDPDADFEADLRENGILQNLLVRPLAPMEGYAQPMHRLVAGERRWRTVGRLIAKGQWRADRLVPCQVRELDDEQHAILALVENLQRKDLKPLEQARAFKRLTDDFGLSTLEISQKIGFTQRNVQHRLKLLELDEDTQAALDDGTITVERAREIASQPKPKVFELNDRDRLMMAEIAHKLEHDGMPRGRRGIGSEIKHVHVGKTWENKVSDPTLQRLITNQIVEVWIDEGKSERTFVRRSHRWPVKAELPKIPKGVAIYQTAFLNEPYPLPKIAAEAVAHRKAEIAQTKIRNKAEREAAAVLAARVEKLIARPLPLWTDEALEFRELLKEAGSGWPWTVTDKAIDETGKKTEWGQARGAFNVYGTDPSARRLLAFAVNAAGADQTAARPQSVTCSHIFGVCINEILIIRALLELATPEMLAKIPDASGAAGSDIDAFITRFRDETGAEPASAAYATPSELAEDDDRELPL